MDVRSWKKILMQWISECGFIELNFFNIEQSDIDEFFKNFCIHHIKAGCRDVEAGTITEYKNGVIGFLKEYYPDFQPHTDDTNSLSPADYLYVYSLLLHYSCVKSPDTFFHEKCQKLSEHAQQCIAWFFNQLLDCDKIDKESLRRAIADVGITQGGSPRQYESFSSGGSASGIANSTANGVPSPQFVAPLSPVKTPRKGGGTVQRISPTTPKSYLLEERTRELYTLRAQLETERYEKGLLEVQIKQYEDKMAKLSQDHKKLKQQFQDLKNDLLNRNSEITSQKDDDEHIKRRLCKELSQKEQEICRLTDNISTLTEEKGLAQEKLAVAEKEIIACMKRIKEQEYRIDELTKELEKKSCTIKYLTDSKAELEHYIMEMRSQSTSNRLDLNNSLDSSNSMSSPENLGCSVVELKLREKENENYELREELMGLKQTCTRLATQIQKLSLQYSEDFEIDLKYVSANRDDFIDPAEHFIVFANCVDQLSKLYKDERNMTMKLQDDLLMLHERNDVLKHNVEDLNENVITLKSVLERLEKSNNDLEIGKMQLEERVLKCTGEINQLQQEKFILAEKLSTLTNERDMHWINCESQKTQQLREVENLKTQIEEQTKNLNENYEKNLQLQEEIDSLQSKVQTAQEKLILKTTGFEMEIKALNEKLLNQKIDLEAHEKTEKMVKEKYEELLIAYEEMKGEARETDSYLATMRTEIASKEGEMERLGNEIILVCKKNRELEERINHLMDEVKNTKQSSDMTINKRDERIKEIEEELKAAHETIESMKIELRATQCDYDSSRSDLHQLTNQVRELSDVLNLTGFVDSGIGSVFSNVLLKIKDTIEQNTRIAKQVETLKFANVEKQTKIEVMEEQLQKAWQEKQSIADKMDALLKEKASEMDVCRREFDDERTELEKRLLEFSASNMCKLAELEMEQQAIKKELSEGSEKTDSGSDVTEKVRGYQEQLEKLTAENSKLKQDFLLLKEQYSRTELKLKNLSQNGPACQDKENAENGETSTKLPLKEVHLRDTEQVLNGVMQERVLGDLQMVKEQPAERDRQAEDRVTALERSQLEQNETIMNLRNKLKELLVERDEAAMATKNIQSQLDFEKRERVVLLDSLEATSDRLHELMDERVNNNALQVRCVELQNQLTRANEEITKLESQVVERETKLLLALDEYQQECGKWEKKVSEASRKLDAQSSDIETIVNAIAEVIAVLEKHLVDFEDETFDEANDFFEDCEAISDNPCFQELKKKLNRLLCVLMKLDERVNKAEDKRDESLECLDNLTKTKNNLEESNKDLKAEVNELQKQLQSGTKCIESKFRSEIKRLNDTVRNLESVNESMNGDNAKLQSKVTALEEKVANFQMSINMLTEKEKSTKDDLEFKDEIIARMKMEESRQKEKLTHIEELQEKCSALENSLKEKTCDFETKLTDLQKKLDQQQEKCAGMEVEYEHKTLEIAALESKSHDCFSISQQFEMQIKDLTQQKQEAEGELVELEQKFKKLNNKHEKMVLECEEHKYQYENTYCEVVRLNGKVETLKLENLKLENDLQEAKRELLRANENVTHLIQQNSSVRMEKESLMDEGQLLKKELERVASYRIAADLKLQNIAGQVKVLEEKLSRAESNLSAIRARVSLSKETDEKLTAQNSKLLEANESATKRIESLSFKLGELQALHSKTERDNEKLTKQLESNAEKCNTLQKDKEAIQRDYEILRKDNENLTKSKGSLEQDNESLLQEKSLLLADSKALKERLNKAEQVAADLSIKIELLEGAKEALEEVKLTLEASEKDSKSKILKLEKLRDVSEEKIRNLSQDLRSSEQTTVRLNHEIGSLNTRINALTEEKRTAHSEHTTKIEELSRFCHNAAEKVKSYEDLIADLRVKATQLEYQNEVVTKQLADVTESLQESREKCELLQLDMEQLQIDLATLRAERSVVEEKYQATYATLQNSEMVNKQLSADKSELVCNLEMQIANLKDELAAKNAELANLQQEVDLLRKAASSKTEGLAELEELRVRVNVMKETIEKEQAITTQLRFDNQILQAKYREAKQRISDESMASEKRVKEYRLEMEGKLEKMKNKMKVLHNEEMTKMKSKQERETAHLKSELDVLKAQNAKYEEHVRKLSSQIGRLNDRNLDYQKENAILSTKLKHLEETSKCKDGFKHPSSMHVRTTSGASAISASTNVDTNFGMEDEEGEIFNNTYLTDLKNGRMSELMSANICPEELQYRNSLLPPHLKSTYAAQYDHGLPEDDMKDGPHSLDDSMLALLSTTEGGAGMRKKVSGATHYKRPGPPTPSKHGGRLSFGGNTEPARAILKEVRDNDNTDSVSSSKTPARFSFFSSRFSMGNVKDEQAASPNDLQSPLQKKQFQWIELAKTDAVCTSTPRKSRTYFEQRRLLDQMTQSSSSTVERQTHRGCAVKSDESVKQGWEDSAAGGVVPSRRASVGTRKRRGRKASLTSSRRASTCRWRGSLAMDDGLAETDSLSEADVISTPQTLSSGNERKSRKRHQRLSINPRGNMFFRYRTPKRTLVRYLTKKMRQSRRLSHFNKARNIPNQKSSCEISPTSTVSINEALEGGEDVTNFKIHIVPKQPHDTTLKANDTRSDAKHLPDSEGCTAVVNIDELQDYMVIEPEDCVEIDDSDDFNININMNIDTQLTTSLVKARSSGSSSDSVISCAQNAGTVSEFDDERGKHFERLLLETESSAPFQVRHRKMTLDEPSNSALNGDVAVTSAHVATSATAMASITSTTLATQNCTSTSGNLSRTIYGASVIINRRMPIINTMHVRKSSIYIRNQDADASNEIVLVTDQTIHIVDLMRMWKQMSSAARCFLAFSTFVSCLSVLWLLVLLVRN